MDFLLKACDGILVGDRATLYLDHGGLHMSMQFSEFIDLYTVCGGLALCK